MSSPLYWPLLLLHVGTASVALLSGFMAMLVRKGSGLHGAAGTVFFGSMLCASGVGAVLSGFIHPSSGNVMVSTLTFYLVATAWVAGKWRDRKAGAFEIAALLFVLSVTALGVTWGIQTSRSQTGARDGYPAAFFFVFGVLTLLFAISDVRMIVRGGVFGAKRIARHLWRMGMALLLAAFSFAGQAKFFPRWVRETNLLQVPAILLFGAMLLWLYRVSVLKRIPRGRGIDVRHTGAIASVVAGAKGAV